MVFYAILIRTLNICFIIEQEQLACGGFVCFLFLLYIVCLYYAVRYISLTKIEHDCLFDDIICIYVQYRHRANLLNKYC